MVGRGGGATLHSFTPNPTPSSTHPFRNVHLPACGSRDSPSRVGGDLPRGGLWLCVWRRGVFCCLTRGGSGRARWRSVAHPSPNGISTDMHPRSCLKSMNGFFRDLCQPIRAEEAAGKTARCGCEAARPSHGPTLLPSARADVLLAGPPIRDPYDTSCISSRSSRGRGRFGRRRALAGWWRTFRGVAWRRGR